MRVRELQFDRRREKLYLVLGDWDMSVREMALEMDF